MLGGTSVGVLSLAGLSVGRRLRLRRVRVGLSQMALAERAGLAHSLASDVENDTQAGSRRRTAGQLAEAAAKMDRALRPLERRWRDLR